MADSEWEELTGLARKCAPVHLHNLLSVLLEGEEELKRAPQPRLALEVLLLRLIHLEPLTSLPEWLAASRCWSDGWPNRRSAEPEPAAGSRRVS